ncbi:hypothetical protein NMY22_g17903 [Coprinellus aureogranulatus]|nr:hypothetical protein NMY22_g17903 [Coprinellus aureogranulatus]
MLVDSTAFEKSVQRLHLSDTGFSAEEWRDLATLVQRMKGIRSIRWVQQGRLHGDVLNAFCSLSHLRSLELLVVGGPPGNSLRLPTSLLANLKFIKLHLLYLGASDSIDDETRDAISHIIKNCPALEHLDIDHSGAQPLVLEDLGVGQEAQMSLLQSIKVGMPILPATVNALSSLIHLSSLELPNCRSQDENLWRALRATRVRLQVVKVEVPSVQLNQYLLSYQGLSAFHLGGPSSDGIDWGDGHIREDLSQLLKSALVFHRTTLHDLRFRAGNLRMEHPWLHVLLCLWHRFRALHRLDLATWPGMVTPVLKTLPALFAEIELVCLNMRRLKGRGYVDGIPHNGISLEEVLAEFERYRFNSKMLPKKWRTLRVVIKALDPHHVKIPGIKLRINRVTYRVVELDDHASGYGFKVDLFATELLNEEGALVLNDFSFSDQPDMSSPSPAAIVFLALSSCPLGRPGVLELAAILNSPSQYNGREVIQNCLRWSGRVPVTVPAAVEPGASCYRTFIKTYQQQDHPLNKMREEQRSILVDLPQELLNRIADERSLPWKDVLHMRLVCKALDAGTRQIVLAKLNLSNMRLSQLKELATSPGACEHHTVDLVFQGFCTGEDSEGWTTIREGDTEYPSTVPPELGDVVCTIVKKLQCVERLRLQDGGYVHAAPVKPDNWSIPIFRAIKEMRSLREIKVRLSGSEDEALKFKTLVSTLSNLKSIKLLSIDNRKTSHVAVIENLSMLLARNPQLEELLVTFRDCRNAFYDFSAVVKSIPTQRGFSPSLRTLHAAQSFSIVPTPPCLKYLERLTTLTITNGLPEGIWPAFTSSGVELERLSLEFGVADGLVEYLSDYRGLKAFSITIVCHSHDLENPSHERELKHLADRLWDEALPRHSGSGEPWPLDQRQVQRLRRLPRLQQLSVSLSITRDGEGVHMSVGEALSSIFTGLPELRSLRNVVIYSTSSSHAEEFIRAVKDHRLEQAPSVMNAELVMEPYDHSSRWFIMFDDENKVYKFGTHDPSVAKLLRGETRPTLLVYR